MTRLVRVDIACSSRDEADRIADALIEKRLAACCQIAPMTSVYRWKGAIERSEEWRLSAKTVRTNFDPIAKMVSSLHSYDLPQITAIPFEATSDYSDWVQENSRPA